MKPSPSFLQFSFYQMIKERSEFFYSLSGKMRMRGPVRPMPTIFRGLSLRDSASDFHSLLTGIDPFRLP